MEPVAAADGYKSGKTKSDRDRAAKKPSAIRSEIKYIIVAAAGILLFLSVFFTGAIGIIGEILQSLSIGLFGLGAYVLPFAVLGAAVYALVSGGIGIGRPIFIKIGIMFWCFIGFVN
ncbi:MAG: hypothetical protein FWE82_00710, partial [Defluviitaleaceae bacterium]|nr:hypothetical protein [Defluviitaleaceae bacterium]